MPTAIVWFRRDLRLADNPALTQALAKFDRIIPVYIHAPEESAPWPDGAASRWWLHHSLKALADALRSLNSRLIMRRGESLDNLRQLIDETGASAVFWNVLYEPAHTVRDRNIEQALNDDGINVEHFNATLLFTPGQILKSDDSPYRVFTPYWKACLSHGLPQSPLATPDTLPVIVDSIDSLPIDDLGLLPDTPWEQKLHGHWQPGEIGANGNLDEFISTTLIDYSVDRDKPGLSGTSRLSPHLHFGEISPRQIIARIERHLAHDQSTGLVSAAENYQRELGWREFAHHLLHHFPHTPEQPLDPRFKHFAWSEDNTRSLEAWQKGVTGIPLVDAGMRQLWHTGWMHNRVRMIVASLLTKNMLVPWQDGAQWFWDTLVDADLASNTLGWQWTAGCGADAAPYFRIFSPILQGEKFDSKGDYVRQWVPEIAALPDNYLHKPWQAPQSVLQECGLKLGRDYPEPILDLKLSREEALTRYQAMK